MEMKPSTITPTGAPHSRGLLVQLPDGRRGRTYFQRLFVEERVAIYLETDDPGTYSADHSLYDRDQVQVTGYIDH